MFPSRFNKVITHYARNSKAPLLFSDLREIVGSQNYESNMKFIMENNLGHVEELTKDNCPECNLDADVKDINKGIIVCENSHRNDVDPLKLKIIDIDANKLVELLFRSLSKHLPLNSFRSAKFTPYTICGFEPVGDMQYDEIKILILSSFKKLKLRDAAILQGLITTTIYDYFILMTEGIDDDAEKFLAYNTGEAVHYVTFEELLEQDSNVAELFKSIQSTINVKAIKLHSFLKNNLTMVQNITEPETFQSLLEYDATLIEKSFKSATSGASTEFENVVGKLFGAFMPVTPLGHNISSLTEGKKIEIPDGIIQVPHDKNLELMFYDCKSVGTETKEKEKKSISQADEDQFERYCKLFSSSKVQMQLSRGIFVANDFSSVNVVNKSLQIRQKDGVPSDLQLVYFPLKSLVKLYTRLTKERAKYSMHFEPDAIMKLFGQGITSEDEDILKQDDNFDTFDKLRKSNTNSVYVIESLIDVFFEHVYSMEPRNKQYLPYIIDLSKRQSTRY